MQYNYKPAQELNFTPDLAYLIGVIQGDGSVYNAPNKNGYFSTVSINITVGKQDVLYAKILRDLIQTAFKCNTYINKQPTYYRVAIHKRSIVRALEKFKQNMKIPKFVFKNNNFLSAYLQGLFDTDGTCIVGPKGKSKIIGFSNNKKVLAESVKFVLEKNFNIYSNIGISRKKHYNPVYMIRISNKSNILKFINLVGFRHPRKNKLTKNMIHFYKNMRTRSIRNKGHENLTYILKRNGEMSTNDIAHKLNLHRETIKEHLEKMEKRGVVKRRIFYFNRWGKVKNSPFKRYYWRLKHG